MLRRPSRISTVRDTDGGSTGTGWKRLSSAPSFSMRLLYSSSVVAPMHWNSPLARAGLSRFAASMAPSAAPAPTMEWISSMKSMMLPASIISLSRTFSRSSNCPLYFVPAMTPAMSSAMSLRSRRGGGTRQETINWARPSTIAVLPTPGSPIRTGLHFFLRQRTWMTLDISFSRPITGSSEFSLAMAVRSRQKNSRAEVASSSDLSSRFLGRACSSVMARSSRTPRSRSRFAAMQLDTAIRPRRMCSVPTVGWFMRPDWRLASCRTRRALVVHPTSCVGMAIPDGFLM
ncbi:MAG: hypothetical protein BWX47_01303 [candidate division Hyd24-12 bacterium ADurb.Bin004]|nr:MAG: hypothetical protein BWX47_01303 [candidate division Hyd24-12 bacterium ADurb.Bin004]